MLILDLEILWYESGGRFDNLNNFMLKYQELTSKKVDLKKHLICNCVDISMVNLGRPVEKPMGKWHWLSIQLASILIVFKFGYRSKILQLVLIKWVIYIIIILVGHCLGILCFFLLNRRSLKIVRWDWLCLLCLLFCSWLWIHARLLLHAWQDQAVFFRP